MEPGPILDLCKDGEKQLNEYRAQQRARDGFQGAILQHSDRLARLAQTVANEMQDGAPGSGVPADTRSALDRANDGTIAAYGGTMCVILRISGATSMFELMEAAWADAAGNAAILNAQAREMAVCVGGSEHTVFAAVVLGDRPDFPVPQTPDLGEVSVYFTGTELLSLPGRTVKVSVSS